METGFVNGLIPAVSHGRRRRALTFLNDREIPYFYGDLRSYT